MRGERNVTHVWEGALLARELDGGVLIVVYPMAFGNGRVCLGTLEDRSGFDDAWCYATCEQAIEAAAIWDGAGDPPVGWHRHIRSGRRRPNGDPAKEYIAP